MFDSNKCNYKKLFLIKGGEILKRKNRTKPDEIKVYDISKKLQKTKKSFELLYDETS